MRHYVSIAAAMAMTFVAGPALCGQVFDNIRTQDKIVCLVNQNSPGFSVPDSAGVYQGFNVDFCRMAAAAILGDAGKADIRGIGFSDSMKTLTAGGADMASRSITDTGTRDADPGLAFIATTFYDGQGFMVPKSLGVSKASELNGASVCAEDGSTTLLNIADWFGDHGLKYRVENIADKTARLQAFYSGKCDVYSSDITALSSDRLLSDKPSDYTILPEVISSEPLTLVSRPDESLQTAIFWAFQLMLNADQYHITSKNIDKVIGNLASQPKAVQRLFASDGATAEMAGKIGLPKDWAYKVISQVGSYSEVFERHLGKGTPFGLELKGTPNALARDGGLMYPYPIR